MLFDLEAVTRTIQDLANTATRASLAGSAFSLDEAAYRATYAQLHEAFLAARSKREEIDAKASAILPAEASDVISGVTKGAARARLSVGSGSQKSLAAELLTVERYLAVRLNAMAAAWDKYREADLEAMAAILRAAAQPS